MLPPKKSIYRSWDSLHAFMGGEETRQMGSRSTLYFEGETIYLMYQKNTIMTFQKDVIHICRSTYKTKVKYTEILNPVLINFGWYYGDVSFGPHKKHWQALKPTRVSPGTPESDYRSVVPLHKSNLAPRSTPFMYAMQWDGKIIGHGGKLTEYQVKRQLASYDVRAAASKRVRRFAYVLGFPNTAKMGGFKLPKDKSPEHAEKLNALARGYGYMHVAHAWANGFVVPTDPSEVEMLTAGMVHLVRDTVQPDLETHHYVFDNNPKLWLRQRPLKGEPHVDSVSW